MLFEVIAFDGDDTLWHNEPMFREAEDRLRALIGRYDCEVLSEQDLYEREARNLRHFGYGTKGFALSMIETAIEATRGEVTGSDILSLIEMAKEMLAHPLHLLEGVEEVLSALVSSQKLMLVTKGDLLEQEAKIARSGIADYFSSIEILSEKTPESYRRVFQKHGVDPNRVLMVGNSLRSDVAPVVRIGGHAVHIPYPTTWIHETVDPEESLQWDYLQLDSIRLLPAMVERLSMNGDGVGLASVADERRERDGRWPR